MESRNDTPSTEMVRAVLSVIAPAHSGFRVEPLAGSYSNHTHLVNIEFPNEPSQQIVLRRYNEANGDCVSKARREFQTLHSLQASEVPVPKPLYLDAEGDLLGSPGIVTAFVPGRQIDAAAEPEKWVASIAQVARMLARIHATPFDETTRQVMMNATVEAAWFLKSGAVPAYMKAHPDGEMIWTTLSEGLPQRRVVEPVLVHLDYWSGNILWDHEQISAVVDWEEAAFGDPAIDVAYCRMELYLQGLDDAADTLLRVYEQENGRHVANLGMWELAAAVRPMLSLDEWLTTPLMAERFNRFIANAKRRTLDQLGR